jgi:3-methyladenine DNA glycosylase AlkD
MAWVTAQPPFFDAPIRTEREAAGRNFEVAPAAQAAAIRSLGKGFAAGAAAGHATLGAHKNRIHGKCSYRPMKRALKTQIERELAAAGDPERAKSSVWFFKTGQGQYGEGDFFLGITVPAMRKIALRYQTLSFVDIQRLLDSKIHEHRSTALEILISQYKNGGKAERQAIFDFYLRNTARVNNWDLVDASAASIVGAHLRTRGRMLLRRLAKSSSLWERRIAIVATFSFIKIGEIDDTFRIAEILLADKHDLIHKAVGWALREAGKVSRDRLLDFLRTHYAALPRTALRYAIERFSPEERKRFLAGVFD